MQVHFVQRNRECWVSAVLASSSPIMRYITSFTFSIRLWDVLILVPNLLFLGFLCLLFQRALLKLYATNLPVFLCFYGLIWICAIFSVLRSAISMGLSSLHVNPDVQDVVNKILWTVVRFVLLTAEISVLIFSLAFGHLESRHSIRAVLTTTGIISLVFSVVQGQLQSQSTTHCVSISLEQLY